MIKLKKCCYEKEEEREDKQEEEVSWMAKPQQTHILGSSWQHTGPQKPAHIPPGPTIQL